MEAESTPKRWTYAEFARLPSEGSTRYEVIDGEVVVTPGPSTRHQRVVGRLFHLLFGFVEANPVGEAFISPLDVLFADGDYLEPDIVFVSADRSDLVSDRGVEGPPDLVVEVVSPATATRDRGIKLDRYRLYGVAEYWVVDPAECTIQVWDLAGGAREPVVHADAETLRWTPRGTDATLEIDLAELFDAE